MPPMDSTMLATLQMLVLIYNNWLNHCIFKAKEMAKEYLIGKVHSDEQKNAKEPTESGTEPQASWSEIIFSPTWSNFLIPLAISVGVYVVFKATQRVLGH